MAFVFFAAALVERGRPLAGQRIVMPAKPCWKKQRRRSRFRRARAGGMRTIVETIEERLKKLAARRGQWGGAEFKRANEELAAGDKDYEAREYVTALEHFCDRAAADHAGEARRRCAGRAAQVRRHRFAGRTLRRCEVGVRSGGEDRAGNKVAELGLKRANTWTKC